ncbi:hypothetical protein GCM10029992_66230 [Glycomyces albus]
MRMASVPLGEPPEIVNAGIGVHGLHVPEECFRLPDLWQLHLYSYEGELEVGGTVHTIRPGHVSLIPADAEVRYRYRGVSEHLYIHARLADRGEAHQVPVMQDAGAAVAVFDGMLRHAITAAASAPARASAEIWTVLWRLTQLRPHHAGEGEHAAVAAALAYIEERLPRPITVPEIAEAAGVSHNHLTRLFRAERARPSSRTSGADAWSGPLTCSASRRSRSRRSPPRSASPTSRRSTRPAAANSENRHAPSARTVREPVLSPNSTVAPTWSRLRSADLLVHLIGGLSRPDPTAQRLLGSRDQ